MKWRQAACSGLPGETAGTGPADGEGIKNVTRISNLDTIRGLLTFTDPKQFLFFTRTPNGRQAGQEFLAGLKERTQNRDNATSATALADLPLGLGDQITSDAATTPCRRSAHSGNVARKCLSWRSAWAWGTVWPL